jgi:transposase
MSVQWCREPRLCHAVRSARIDLWEISTSIYCSYTTTTRSSQLRNTAPNLAASQHDQIYDMILSKSLTDAQMADVAGYSTRSIKAIRSNFRCFGTTKAPSNGVGRPRCLTPPMRQALREYLLDKPDRYLDELAILLQDDFDVLVTTVSISRALTSMGWSKKSVRRVARQRNADLRDLYLYNLSAFRSYHLVYLVGNESFERS